MGDFTDLWKDIRLQEGLEQTFDLSDPVESDNFDGVGFVEWVVPITKAIAPLITGLFGYLVAKRGEIEIDRDGTKIRMKNMKASQLKEIIAALDEN